ncbi:MAG: hypothetical protein O3C40_24885 [Planctomycetota bacterium]|nr:hypothetical protein [Planctomycetota bacterium]
MDTDNSTNRSRQLRTSLIELVFQRDEADLPDIEIIQDTLVEDRRLTSEIERLCERATQLAREQQQLEELQQELRATKERLSRTRDRLPLLYEPLGEAAYTAFLVGNLPDQPLFHERRANETKRADLKKQYDDLNQASGIFEKAKAKAKQAILWGQITYEESRVNGLNADVGKQLIETQSEATVESEQTMAILAQVGDVRRQVEQYEVEFKSRNATVEAKKAEICSRFGLEDIQYAKQLQGEILRCKKAAAEKSNEQATLKSELPDRPIACSYRIVSDPTEHAAWQNTQRTQNRPGGRADIVISAIAKSKSLSCATVMLQCARRNRQSGACESISPAIGCQS